MEKTIYNNVDELLKKKEDIYNSLFELLKIKKKLISSIPNNTNNIIDDKFKNLKY